MWLPRLILTLFSENDQEYRNWKKAFMAYFKILHHLQKIGKVVKNFH
jgi:hypothetical protein